MAVAAVEPAVRETVREMVVRETAAQGIIYPGIWG